MTIAAMANTIELGDGIPNYLTPPQAPQYAPIVNLVASGSQNARIEWIVYTWVNPFGESLASPEVEVYVPANYVVSVYPQHSFADTYIPDLQGWNCYIGTTGSGKETKQNTTLLVIPTSIGGINSGVLLGGNVFQEPASGLIAGGALPTVGTNVPNLISGITNLADTPPAFGSFSQTNTPAGTVNTNTGRTQMSTQGYVSALVLAVTNNTSFTFNSPVTPTSSTGTILTYTASIVNSSVSNVNSISLNSATPLGTILVQRNTVGNKTDTQSLPPAPNGTYVIQGSPQITNAAAVCSSMAGLPASWVSFVQTSGGYQVP